MANAATEDDTAMTDDEEGRRAYEETVERRRVARRVRIAGMDWSLETLFTLLVVGVILGLGAALGWHFAQRLLR